MLSGDRLEQLRVGDFDQLISQMPPAVQKSAVLGQVIEVMLASPRSRKVYVIDVEGNLVGAVTSESVMKLVVHRAGIGENSAKPFIELIGQVLREGVEQAMEKAHPVKPSTPLMVALSLMHDHHLTEVPVVDDDYKLIGELVGLELFGPMDLFARTKA